MQGATLFRSPSVWFLILAIFLPTVASAAEVRGRIWDASTGAAPAGGEVQLSCGGNPNPYILRGSGNYSIRDVSSGTCQVTVTTSGGSATRSISVNKPVVQFSGETRAIGNRIVLIAR
jgi:hypothetical protein